MTSHISKVSQESLLRQAVLNTSQSIELLREAVSNSVDANAKSIDIQLVNIEGEMWNIVIQDDGNGMEMRHLSAFFNAGESVKDFPQTAIGEKGLGSKTTFVAKKIIVESRRHTDPTSLIVGEMHDPFAALSGGTLPEYAVAVDPDGYSSKLLSQGTRIILEQVHLSRFNGKKTDKPEEIAQRVMHYLRTMCATGTVKNRHAQQIHVIQNVSNVAAIPMVSVEVSSASGTENVGPYPGTFQVPDINVSPKGGEVEHGVARNSRKFCDVYDFSRSRTISIAGKQRTIHYDGTIVIAGDSVRSEMLRHELKQGLTHKSQMGMHLSKDFIPLRNDVGLSRELLGGEWYYEHKAFLNCQEFQLNADRNVITNEESDEVSWIWADFEEQVWPNILAKSKAYREMKNHEDLAIEAAKRTVQAQELKTAYSTEKDVVFRDPSKILTFVKRPKKEADVSHLLAMMVQSGQWEQELTPIRKFGQYIDASTDVLIEDESGAVLLAEIEMKLANLFSHRHPMTSYDLVVVWSLGGMSMGDSQQAPWGANGATVAVALIQTVSGGWALKWGTHQKPVLVLEDIL